LASYFAAAVFYYCQINISGPKSKRENADDLLAEAKKLEEIAAIKIIRQ